MLSQLLNTEAHTYKSHPKVITSYLRSTKKGNAFTRVCNSFTRVECLLHIGRLTVDCSPHPRPWTLDLTLPRTMDCWLSLDHELLTHSSLPSPQPQHLRLVYRKIIVWGRGPYCLVILLGGCLFTHWVFRITWDIKLPEAKTIDAKLHKTKVNVWSFAYKIYAMQNVKTTTNTSIAIMNKLRFLSQN